MWNKKRRQMRTVYTAYCPPLFVSGELFKKDGAFFIVTDEVDERGFKKSYPVDPRTIEIKSYEDSEEDSARDAW